jgi:hypothetical protein
VVGRCGLQPEGHGASAVTSPPLTALTYAGKKTCGLERQIGSLLGLGCPPCFRCLHQVWELAEVAARLQRRFVLTAICRLRPVNSRSLPCHGHRFLSRRSPRGGSEARKAISGRRHRLLLSRSTTYTTASSLPELRPGPLPSASPGVNAVSIPDWNRPPELRTPPRLDCVRQSQPKSKS